MRPTVTKAATVPRWKLPLGNLVAVAAGLVAGALLLWVTHRSVGDAYYNMYAASFGTPDGWEATLSRAAPLALAGMAVTTGLRMGLWNIGGEGQILIGAASATAVAFTLPGLSIWLLLPLMALGAAVGGAVWILIAAVPRAFLGVNEIIVTLFLNYIAIRLVSLLVFGPWKDPGAAGFAYSRLISDHGRIGTIPGTSVSWGLVGVLVVAAVLSWLLDRTRWGFSVDVAGGNERLPRYLGFSRNAKVLSVMALSGALAATAGMLQLSGTTGRLQPDLSAGYGYAGILVAFLAGRRLVAVLAVAVLFSGLIQGGFALQNSGVPSALSSVIQACIILFVLAARTLILYRVRWSSATGRRPAGSSSSGRPEPTAAGPSREHSSSEARS